MTKKRVLLFIVIFFLILLFSGCAKEQPEINDKNFIIHGLEYDNAFYPTEIGGKLAYIAIEDDEWFVVYNGTEGKYVLS